MKTAKELQIGAKRIHAPLRARAESSASTPWPLPEFATLNWRETVTAFYSAYPEASVRDVWKARKTKAALDALLDQA